MNSLQDVLQRYLQGRLNLVVRVQRRHLNVSDVREIGAQPLDDFAVYNRAAAVADEVQGRSEHITIQFLIQANKCGKERVGSRLGKPRVADVGLVEPVHDQDQGLAVDGDILDVPP